MQDQFAFLLGGNTQKRFKLRNTLLLPAGVLPKTVSIRPLDYSALTSPNEYETNHCDDFLPISGYKSAKLRKIHIPIVSMDECRRVYRGRSSITKRQLCAGGFQGMDSCAGDSGGPLMIPTAHAKGSIKFVQHGIVSFGPRYCGTDGQPGIYTKVGWYLRWILDNMRRWDDG